MSLSIGVLCDQYLLSFIWSDQWMGFHVTSVCYYSAEVTNGWVFMSPVFIIQLKWPMDGFSCHQCLLSFSWSDQWMGFHVTSVCYHSAKVTSGWVFMSPVFVIIQLKWPVGGFSCHQCLLSFSWSDQWMGFHVTSVCYHSAEVTSRWVFTSPVFVIIQLKWPVGGFSCHTSAESPKSPVKLVFMSPVSPRSPKSPMEHSNWRERMGQWLLSLTSRFSTSQIIIILFPAPQLMLKVSSLCLSVSLSLSLSLTRLIKKTHWCLTKFSCP